MTQELKDKITPVYDPIYDFLISPGRIIRRDRLEEARANHQIAPDKYLDGWVEETLANLSDNQQEQLEYFYDREAELGLGLFILARDLRVDQKEMTIQQFITYLEEMPLEELVFYLLICSYNWEQQEDLSPNLVKEFIASQNLYQVIETKFNGSTEVKWKLFKLLDNPDQVISELIKFLTNYYQTIYQSEAERAEKKVDDYLTNNRDKIKDYVAQGIKEFNYSAYQFEEIIAVVTYFSEISFLHYGPDLFLVGYRFTHFLDGILSSQLDIDQVTGFLKVMADKTRLKILLELSNGANYAGELADEFEVSNATISYHISKFADLGLIKTDHDQNKAYYTLRQEKIENLIEELQQLFLANN